MSAFDQQITTLPNVYIHPSAIIETARIGFGTDINPFVHVMSSAIIGKNCNICAFATIDEGVILEDDITIMNNAYIAQGVYLKKGVYIGPNVVITNDLLPRSPRASCFAFKYEKDELWLTKTIIGEYASIGANTTIVCGNNIGKHALVGAGSVMTMEVPAFALVKGNPARFSYWIDKNCQRVKSPPSVDQHNDQNQDEYIG